MLINFTKLQKRYSTSQGLSSGQYTTLYDNTRYWFSFLVPEGHTQNASVFNYGGYLGIGALFNDQTRWSGSFGGSFIIGRSQRLFINLGPVISQVDRLSKPYKTDFFYQKSFDIIPVSREWEVSWMFGFSWIIGK